MGLGGAGTVGFIYFRGAQFSEGTVLWASGCSAPPTKRGRSQRRLLLLEGDSNLPVPGHSEQRGGGISIRH